MASDERRMRLRVMAASITRRVGRRDYFSSETEPGLAVSTSDEGWFGCGSATRVEGVSCASRMRGRCVLHSEWQYEAIHARERARWPGTWRACAPRGTCRG